MRRAFLSMIAEFLVESVLMLFAKIIKISVCLLKLQLPKLARWHCSVTKFSLGISRNSLFLMISREHR